MQALKTIWQKALVILDRKEVVAFVIAVALLVLAQSGIVEKLGIAEADAQAVESTAIAVFIGAFVEGKFKPEAYGNGWLTWFKSQKNLGLALMVFLATANAVLGLFGLHLPEGLMGVLGRFMPLAMLLLGGLDAYRESIPGPGMSARQ